MIDLLEHKHIFLSNVWYQKSDFIFLQTNISGSSDKPCEWIYMNQFSAVPYFLAMFLRTYFFIFRIQVFINLRCCMHQSQKPKLVVKVKEKIGKRWEISQFASRFSSKLQFFFLNWRLKNLRIFLIYKSAQICLFSVYVLNVRTE